MFSPAKAITTSALIVAIGGVMLIARPFDQQGPSVLGATIDPCIAPVLPVTGTIIFGTVKGLTRSNS